MVYEAAVKGGEPFKIKVMFSNRDEMDDYLDGEVDATKEEYFQYQAARTPTDRAVKNEELNNARMAFAKSEGYSVAETRNVWRRKKRISDEKQI